MPDLDLAKELESNLSGKRNNSWQRPNAHSPPSRNSTTEAAISAIRRWDISPESSSQQNAEDGEHIELADNIKSLQVDSREYRFFGKSSGAMLIKTAIDLKQEFTGRKTDMKPVVLGERRPEFWQPLPWEDNASDNSSLNYTFPEADLLASLINAYFDNKSCTTTTICSLQLSCWSVRLDRGISMIEESYLTEFALGIRADGGISIKFNYFIVYVFNLLLLSFLTCCAAFGIRLAQDVGAHRRKPTKPLTVENELWKRAFWVLVCMDRMFSTGLGRPCAIQDEDYDLDMPVECDDEYWEHPDPAMAFRQPPGKPSTVSAFNTFIRLNVLLSIALRTIYAINKSKILMGFGEVQWEQHIVAELDSALNRWVDSVPDHLRWDPNREDETFFSQSVMLYSHYYLVQILVHRPFIPSPKKPSPLSFPSLAICTNAARSASHIIDVQRKRQTSVLPFSQITTFTAGIVLLLNIWGGKRSGLSTDPNKEMTDVYKCMQSLKCCEDKWHSCGRLWDILYELASVGELPLPNASPTATNKRERGAESPMSSAETSEGSPCLSLSDAPVSPDSRSIAGSRRVSAATSGNFDFLKPTATATSSLHHTAVGESALSTDSSPGMQLFSLPVYSNELGRLPLYGQVNFSARPHPNSQPLDWCPPHRAGSSSSNVPEIVTHSQYIPPEYYNYGHNESGVAPPTDSAVHDSMLYHNGPLNDTAGPGLSSVAAYSGDSPLHPSDGLLSSRNGVNMPMSLDSDTFAMWSNAPSGFELDDWGTYLTNVSELTQTMNRGQDSFQQG
ncbi:hypothetical protein LENED_000811 [Lentinula edodes]|uniref:Xylanolytic transcriptional activator regulatory domain-containing protein n=1 Tax=Lentinula edodes TaxID=5353 RepID=A0A1Q3DWL3_LENED|nr:hypothetical protein LENED_000811 [Lentinula edodes]